MALPLPAPLDSGLREKCSSFGASRLDSGLDPHPSPLPNGEGESRLRLAWIPAPHRGTGQAYDRRNDEFGGGNHSSGIGVRDMLSYEDWRRSCLPPPLWIPAFAGNTYGLAQAT